ncbi:dienelactone hydrolase family protein [Hamadaea tsunoensis]|uniref:dienelactone hydrolase family protein n=1 Tax=Hamadaea tsunoensis TaxID=53368 RepID=UPI00041E0BC0|nr:dienelactone hydrolase family protein [Hamadaea tsunoensis]
MCHDSDASPPVFGPPVSAVTAAGGVLTSVDGQPFASYLAAPREPSGAAVVVLPDNRGLSGFYEQLCVRLAEQGHWALAVDYYSRTAGLEYASRTGFDDLATLMPHLMGLKKETLYGDIQTGIDHVRRLSDRPVATVGFCVGGRFAFLTGRPEFELAGVAGFYGALDPINGAPGPIQLAADLRTPVLGLFGGADEGIPAEAVARFGAALAAAGVRHDLVTYPGAPHSFFDLHQEEHLAASADAWRRLLEFLGGL